MTDKAANQALSAKIRNEQMKMQPDQVSMAIANDRTPEQLDRTAPRTAGVMDEQFPTAGLTSYDKRDKVMEAKLALQKEGEVGVTPFGKLEATDADFKWAQKKQATVEAANFQKWFAKEFDLMSPAQKKRAKELYPEFYAQRKKLLKQQTKNLYDLTRIKLEGIESREDLMKTYMAETGRLDLGPLQNLMHPEQGVGSEALNQSRFHRGLANPFLVFGKEALPANQHTRFDQAKNFANRYSTGAPQALGLGDQGFPPFKDTIKTNQGDAAWYTVLSNKAV